MEKTKPMMNDRKRNTLCFRLPNGVIWTVVAGNAVPNAFPGHCLGYGINKEKMNAFGFCQTPTFAHLSERIQIL